MQPEEFRKLIAVDEKLQLGETCRVRWTNCYRSYEAEGIIARLNRQSVAVELTQAKENYPIGHTIKVARITDWKNWTPNNCVLAGRD